VSDDVLAVRLDSANRPTVTSDGRRLKLHEPSVTALGLSERREGAVRRKLEKYYVDPPGTPVAAAIPLGAIYVLSEDNRLDVPQFERLEKIPGALVLQRNGYRPRLAKAMARVGNPVAVTAAILQHAPVYQLTRPSGLTRLSQLVDALQVHWREETR
jgi:hypothetical protein